MTVTQAIDALNEAERIIRDVQEKVVDEKGNAYVYVGDSRRYVTRRFDKRLCGILVGLNAAIDDLYV